MPDATTAGPACPATSGPAGPPVSRPTTSSWSISTNSTIRLGELAGDQLRVGGRAGVRVVGGLVGEVLDEQQVVGLGRVPVHPEGQRALLAPGPSGANSATMASTLSCVPSLSLMGNTLTSMSSLLSARVAAPRMRRDVGRMPAPPRPGLARSGHGRPARPELRGVRIWPAPAPAVPYTWAMTTYSAVDHDRHLLPARLRREAAGRATSARSSWPRRPRRPGTAPACAAGPTGWRARSRPGAPELVCRRCS